MRTMRVLILPILVVACGDDSSSSGGSGGSNSSSSTSTSVSSGAGGGTTELDIVAYSTQDDRPVLLSDGAVPVFALYESFTAPTTTRILEIPLPTGPQRDIARFEGHAGLVADAPAGVLFTTWSNGVPSGIARATTADEAPIPIDVPEGAHDEFSIIGFGTGRVAFRTQLADGAHVMTTDEQGGSSLDLGRAAEGFPPGAIHNSLFFVAEQDGNPTIVGADLPDGEPTFVADVDASLVAIATYLDEVYWLDIDGAGTLWRATQDGGAPESIWTGAAMPLLAVDDDGVYVVALDASGSAIVTSLPRTGGPAASLSPPLDAVSSMVVGGGNVYVVTDVELPDPRSQAITVQSCVVRFPKKP